MTDLTLFLRGCYLLSLLRPMLPSVGGFASSSDGYFLWQVKYGKMLEHEVSWKVLEIWPKTITIPD